MQGHVPTWLCLARGAMQMAGSLYRQGLKQALDLAYQMICRNGKRNIFLALSYHDVLFDKGSTAKIRCPMQFGAKRRKRPWPLPNSQRLQPRLLPAGTAGGCRSRAAGSIYGNAQSEMDLGSFLLLLLDCARKLRQVQTTRRAKIRARKQNENSNQCTALHKSRCQWAFDHHCERGYRADCSATRLARPRKTQRCVAKVLDRWILGMEWSARLRNLVHVCMCGYRDGRCGNSLRCARLVRNSARSAHRRHALSVISGRVVAHRSNYAHVLRRKSQSAQLASVWHSVSSPCR